MIRALLIRAYPRSWRNEFGPELAGVLAQRKLTPALVADVAASAALQHLRNDPWKICALGLGVWTLSLLFLAFEGVVGRPAFLWCYFAGQLFLFAAGTWTVMRRNCGIRSATTASAKAAILPVVACIIVAGLSMLHYWGGSREIQGHNTAYWIWKNVAVSVLAAFVFSLAGASFGRLVNYFRRTARART
jgi:hypothetical protein